VERDYLPDDREPEAEAGRCVLVPVETGKAIEDARQPARIGE